VELTSLISKQKLFLLSLSAGLTAIYFTLIWSADDTGHITVSALVFFCVFSLVREQHTQFILKQDWISCLLGFFLVGWILLNSSSSTNAYVVRLFPFLCGLAISLIASSWRYLQQFLKPLILLFILSVPSYLAYHFVDLAPLTAKTSSLMLWYAGFEIYVKGVVLGLVDREAVRVVYDCSGIDMVLYMSTMSVVCLVMCPITSFFKYWFPVIAAMLGFLLNSLRVAMLVIFLGSDQEAFNQWHTGTGSYFFALLGIITLGLTYWFFLRLEPSDVEFEAELMD
jgi:cyanoexosortase A